MVLVMACPGLYCKAIIAYNKVYEKPFVAQHGAQLTIYQLHVPDDQVRNFSDEDTLCVLLYNRIPPEWVDHAYTYGVVYLEQQFHQLMMSLDNFCEVDNERLEHLQDGWREMTEENQYRLMFKHTEESAAGLYPEATGLYYYIGMDLNVGQLWKQTPAHVVDATAAGGPTTPPIPESEPLSATTNIATKESVKTAEAGGDPQGKKTG
ncbi:hypothetical protein C0992_005265 [Termitomyces sp. T32_za158]|nr:hypothetical protein C0992_005265 [Termitomyces sp. T32_za158]